jgi:hypothetical protein
MSTRKRFDPALYAENDSLAKNAVKNSLKGTSFQVMENPKKRGVDLLVYKDSVHIAYIETEIKRFKWETGDFKYTTVQLPDRKRKFCELGLPTLFIIWNLDQTAFLAFWDKDVLTSPSVEVANKYNFRGEYFFQIPVEKCFQENLEEVLKGPT